MGRRTRWRAALGAAIGASVALADAALALEPAASRERQLDRVQMHRNGARGVAYVPRAAPDGSGEPDLIAFRAASVLRLPGDPDENVRGGLYPIDADGDGTLEFLHFNGYRVMRVIGRDGTRRWEDREEGRRTHRDYVHRDTLAVLDADGDRRQEIVHCWADRGGKRLVLRDGATGAIRRSVELAGDDPGGECQIAAFRVEGREEPVILVSRGGDAAGAGCPRDFIDLWPVTAAYGPDLRRLWQRATCDAGHYAWPLDEDRDGRAEGVFVGKYLLRADGTLACTLPNWGGDHVDSLVVADFDPGSDGFEVVAVGRSGGRVYRAADCDLRAERPGDVLDDPQHVNAALLDPGSGAPSLVVRSRAGISDGPGQVHLVDIRLRRLRDIRERDPRHLRPMQNANLDDARAAEDLVTSFGQVIDAEGRVRLDTGWYWGRDGGSDDEASQPYRRWTSAPVVVDLDGDGRDEIVTWGRESIVVGSLRGDGDGGDDGDGDDDDGSDDDGAGSGDRNSFNDRPGGRRAAYNDHGERRSRFNERGRSQRETETETGTDGGIGTGTGTETGGGSGTETETGSGSETGSGTETGTGLEAE